MSLSFIKAVDCIDKHFNQRSMSSDTITTKKRYVIPTMTTGAGKKIYLPQRKKRTFKKQPLVLRFVIPGVVPSKKNLKIATINLKKIMHLVRQMVAEKWSFVRFYKELLAVKPFIRYSKKFTEWEEATRKDILIQAERWCRSYERHDLLFPITKSSIAIYHYWKDDYRRDNSNKMETINDIFVKANLIADDSWRHLPKIEAEADLYDGEIVEHITVVTLTAYDW